MAWPPPTFRVDYTDATPQQTEHPAAHNGVNDSLNQDFVPKIDAVQTDADNAQASADQVANDLATHIASAKRTDLFLRLEQQVNGTVTHFGKWPITVRQFHSQVAVRQTSEIPTTIFPFTPGGVTALTWLNWSIVDADDAIALRPRTRQVTGWMTFLQQGQQTNHVGAMIRRSDDNSNVYVQSANGSQQRAIGSDVADPSPLATNWERLWVNMLWQLD